MSDRLFGAGLDDGHILGQQIIAGHPGLAGQARGNDHHIGVGRILVIIGAGHPVIKPFHRSALQQIQGLALGNPLRHIEKNHITKILGSCPVRCRCSHISCPDNRNLLSHLSFLIN